MFSYPQSSDHDSLEVKRPALAPALRGRTTMASRSVLRRAMSISAVVITVHLGAPPAGAFGNWTESKEPVYTQPEPGKALVYVVRERFLPDPLQGALEVFLDDVPLGFLKLRKYLHAQADPGQRLLWGPRKGHPVSVVLQAGATYVFAIDEVWESSGGANVLRSTSWRQEDANAIAGVVQRYRLQHVEVTTSGVEKLRTAALKGIDEARRAAVPLGGSAATVSAAVPLALPHTFEGVMYRPRKVGFTIKVFKSKGALRVAADGIEFSSEEDHLVIPMADVRSISRGPLGINQDLPWTIVEYAAASGPQTAAFAHQLAGIAPPIDPADIEATIREALDRQKLSPLEQVRKTVAAAVKFEEAGSLNVPDLDTKFAAHDAARRLREDLHRVDPVLTAHLREHPDDVEALFLQARLDRALVMLGPTVITAGKVQPDPLGPQRDPHAALDRILELQPGNAEAHYLKARLYGVIDPLTGKMKEPDKALQEAGLAVQAEPEQVAYREALAIYLLGIGQESEAEQVFLKAGRADHPIVVLLEDRTRLPLPAGATPHPERAGKVAEYSRGIGAFGALPFPGLRVTVYSLDMGLTEVEEFYRKRWPDIRFDRDSGSLAAHLEWSGTELVASATRPDKIKGVPSGVVLTIGDLRQFEAEEPEDSPERLSGKTVVMFLNFRDVNGYRP